LDDSLLWYNKSWATISVFYSLAEKFATGRIIYSFTQKVSNE